MIKAVQEANFEYKGFPCIIRFLPDGYRCGYVGIPENRKAELKIDTDSIQCHGLINYEENTLPDSDENGFYWIGFDCGHACDGRDIITAKKLFADNEEALKYIQRQEKWGGFELYENYPPVTLEKCIEECKSIVAQIIKKRGELQC